jgi:hypothetical protein
MPRTPVSLALLVAVPSLAGCAPSYRCDTRPIDQTCTEYLEVSEDSARAGFENACAAAHGAWAEDFCSRIHVLGACDSVMGSQRVRTLFYADSGMTVEQVQSTCAALGQTFVASP